MFTDLKIRKLTRHIREDSQLVQKSLLLRYRAAADTNHQPVNFKDAGFKVYSQHDEDGILLYIFSLIGMGSRRCIELCCGNGIECNTANLIINHGWTGLLCDGNKRNCRTARRFYELNPRTKYWPPAVCHAWLTRGSLNDLIANFGYEGEVDLLSIDVDGNDLHFWRALNVVRPRVVVIEMNCLWGPTASVTTPYADDFVAQFTRHGSDYAGASLPAIVKVGHEKDYRLVGVNAISTNAFFIRNDIGSHLLPEVQPEDCFNHPRAVFAMNHRLPDVEGMQWEEV